MSYRAVSACRVCGGPLKVVLDLGRHCLAGQFPAAGEPDPPSFPLELACCREGCGLVQLAQTVDPELQFRNYWYRSGVSATMREHLQGLAAEAWEMLPPADGVRRVLDVGCSDHTLLEYTPAGYRCRYGIDPCAVCGGGEVHRAFGFFPRDLPREWPSFDLVYTVATFYDADDPVGFARAVHDCLTPNGVWCLEVANLPDMARNLSYDAVLHEHLCYYCMPTLREVLARAGLKVLRSEANNCNGGSLRVYARRGPAAAVPHRQVPRAWLAGFATSVREHRAALLSYLSGCVRAGKRVHLLGASSKANTVLQFCSIDRTLVEAASDRDPRKHGRRTPGSGLPILSEEESRARRPDVYLSVLSHFRSELLMREKAAGFRGDVVFVLPQIQVNHL
jgi:hypothetical protein